MKTIDIQEAKIDLARLVEAAAKGESFIIEKDGQPMVTVVGFEAVTEQKSTRLDFLKGQIVVPDDFDILGNEEIAALFGGGNEAAA